MELTLYQPELSNILFYEPRTLNYSEVICRTIWNKIFRKEVLLKTIKFIDTENNKKLHFNYGEDTIMNVLNFQFSINYSNIYLPGYMYNIRKISISHSNLGTENDIIICQNFFLYFKLFYKYIKYFNKNINYFLFEINKYQNYLIKLKESNSTEYILEAILFFNEIIKENNISHNFRSLIFNLSKIFNEN